MLVKNLAAEIKDGLILNNILAKHAEERPNAPALQWKNDIPITYLELFSTCCGIAEQLKNLGLQPDEKVLIMLPNSLEILFTWFSVNLAGGIEVPINVHYKGSYLVHEANDCEARIAVVHEQYLDRFIDVQSELQYIKNIIVVGPNENQLTSSEKWDLQPWEEILTPASNTFVPAKREVSDTQAILYTSGTTGPSKGVVMPFGLCNAFAAGVIHAAELTENDVSYVCLPLFHANAQFMQVLPTLYVGGRVCAWPGFSASNWLQQIRECGATVTNTLGVMCEFVYRQPEKEDDACNPLRAMITLPAPKDIALGFEKRFDVQCLEGYGMTEMSVITYRTKNERIRLGSAGKALEWYEVKIVNPETDEILEPNQTGEIVVRPKLSWTFMKGYNRVPHKTVEAWRNLWFHTGDTGKMDEEGYLYFADRIKDAIRRRGENISSQVIEGVVNSHPSIKESAAISVPSDLGAGAEDEVKICVVLMDGEEMPPEKLIRYCEKNMPYFAVPRYIEFMEELPKTANEKIRKVALRERGITPETWDRENAGIIVKKS